MHSLTTNFPDLLVIGTICCIVLTACSGQISTNTAPTSNVRVESKSASHLPSQDELSQSTYALEGAISDGCLVAWRMAVRGDYKNALQKLNTLQLKYPKSPTISFMKGQVLELSGDKKGAVQYYREGIRDNEYDGIQRFKLAEALRTTGDINAAESQYRHLIKTSPQFVDARIGLAKVLRNGHPGSNEAEQQLKEVLKIDPTNQEALAMLKETSTKAQEKSSALPK